MYKRLLIVVLLVAFAAGSAFKASASSLPTSVTHTAQAATCANADFMTGVGKDINDLATQFNGLVLKDVAATANLFLSFSGMRQKYENMRVDPECLDLQFETILAYANASDILALAMAAQIDTANTDAYTKIMSSQLTRFQNNLQTVSVVAGIATPAADSTPVGRVSGIVSTTCADADFLTQLGKDLNDFSTALNGTDMKDNTAISQTLLSVSALRQQYEDMKAPSGCEITQLTTIVALANATDLLGLSLAVKADSANADAYAKGIDAQSTRAQQLIQKVIDNATAGAATPAATMAATEEAD